MKVRWSCPLCHAYTTVWYPSWPAFIYGRIMWKEVLEHIRYGHPELFKQEVGVDGDND